MDHNRTEQIAELKSLRLHYKRIETVEDSDKFDFLGKTIYIYFPEHLLAATTPPGFGPTGSLCEAKPRYRYL